MEPDEFDYDRNNEAAKPLPDSFATKIFTDKYKEREYSFSETEYQVVNEAMEEYAEAKSQEVAIGFYEWMQGNYEYTGYKMLVDGIWIYRTKNARHAADEFTLSELFLKYKQSKDGK